MSEPLIGTWREIAAGFLKVGATAYGGPAIMGVMQAEFRERRGWVSKPRSLEGLALVSVLPGATATQLGIFLGYIRGGWWGGLLAGLCFAAPGFVVMLALAVAYAALGVSPVLRGALYGLGPVVLGIFIVALHRLGRAALRGWPHRLIAVGAALAALLSPVGVAATLLLAGGVGLVLFHARRAGATVLLVLVAAIALFPLLAVPPIGAPPAVDATPRLTSVVALFAAIGAFTFGGGLSMVALLEEHVVTRLHWLTPQGFVAGLALGQLTPGPVLMVAAYVGYTVLGIPGAAAAAAAAFLPSFVLMLAAPGLRSRQEPRVDEGDHPGDRAGRDRGDVDRARAPGSPRVPDPLALVMLVVTVVALMVWQVAPLPAMVAGAVVGVLRSRLGDLPGLRAAVRLGAS